MPTHVTQHASERGRERLGLPTVAVSRLAARAFERGQGPGDFAGGFRRLLDKMAIRDECTIRVYGEYIYIFDARQPRDPKLVTVVIVPGKFRRLLRRLRMAES